MAASNYSGTKTEIDDRRRLTEVEKRHIALFPEGEREEIRQILAAKGLSGPSLEDAVAAVTANKETWIATMLAEEYGLAASVARRSWPALRPSWPSCCAALSRCCRTCSGWLRRWHGPRP